MAPATTIGAAHPVSIGGFPMGGEQKQDETMKSKVENFAVSYIEAIAGKRQRNVDWAKSAVKESVSISADKALQLKVVDLIANDMPDLLRQLNGRVVDGKPLKTAGAEVSEIAMSPSEHVLQTFSHPEVMLILMLIAFYGIIAEVTTPGAILPGVAGAIALVLALYMVNPPCECDGACPHRTRVGAVRFRHLCPDARRAHCRRDHLVLSRPAPVLQQR